MDDLLMIDLQYIYQNELDKTCFQHDMVYGDFKDIPRRTAPDKIFVIKHIILPKIQNMMDIKEVLLQWFINISMKRFQVVLLKIKSHKLKN